MTTQKVRIFGAAGAVLATLSLLLAVHGYAAGIQRAAPREVIEMEPVTVVGQLPRHLAADPSPHVGEL
jgi:hypothetical protein